MLKLTEHENVIKIFDIFQGDREHIHVLMDFCNYDLHNFLTSETHNSPEIYDNIFGQIADGLHFLHTHTPQIVHRDIHPGNVLVKQAESEKAIMVKIADFGISHVVSTEIGSPRHTALGVFMAPEAMSASHMELKYHPTVDIYGLGLIYNYMYCFSQSWIYEYLHGWSHSQRSKYSCVHERCQNKKQMDSACNWRYRRSTHM